MAKYLIDFETRSTLSITVGTERYLHTRDSDIVCMSWKREGEPTKLWLPGAPVPFKLEPDDKVYAHNAQFDWRVWNVLGKRYKLPELPLSQVVDVMAICGRYTFPQKLSMVGKVLKLPVQKSSDGRKLMKKICSPPFKFTRTELVRFYKYCINDVDTMYALLNALPLDHLSESEQQVWLETVQINRNGVPIDVAMAKRIYNVIEFYKKREMKKIPELTDGMVNTTGQRDKIIEWLSDYQDVELLDLQKETVEAVLKEDISDDARMLLTMRQDLNQTSLAKYKRVLEQVFHERMYNNLRYYGAATGRYAGLAFQLHNMPRATIKLIEETIKKFFDTSILSDGSDVLFCAKALIRSLLTAPEGKRIYVADYKAIEDMLLIWLAEEEEALTDVRSGLDRYIVMAQSLYNIPYDQINSTQRFLGKTLVLGAGYNLGGVGFHAYAEGFGITDLTVEDAILAVKVYRQKHKKIKQFWYQIKDCSVEAVLNPGMTYTYNKCSFTLVRDRTGREWLRLRLPSGRSLFYCEPKVQPDTYGLIVTHMGINSKNKQWQRLKLIPGRITENIIQALARDPLVYAKSRLIKEGFTVIGSIHDEILCEEPDQGEELLDKMIKFMTELPPWAEGLPLAAEGAVLKRYKKI